jgi:hypothetical protein
MSRQLSPLLDPFFTPLGGRNWTRGVRRTISSAVIAHSRHHLVDVDTGAMTTPHGKPPLVNSRTLLHHAPMELNPGLQYKVP